MKPPPRDDPGPELTEADRRAIAEIRRKLDVEFRQRLDAEYGPADEHDDGDPAARARRPRVAEAIARASTRARRVTSWARHRTGRRTAVAAAFVMGLVAGGVLGTMAVLVWDRGPRPTSSSDTRAETPASERRTGVATTSPLSDGVATTTPPSRGNAPTVPPSGGDAATVPPSHANAPTLPSSERDAAIARAPAAEDASAAGPPANKQVPKPTAAAVDETARLRDALDQWIDATQRGDIAAQMRFYPARVPVFYTWRNVTREAIRAEKIKVFGAARHLDITTSAPAVALAQDRLTAVTRFRKRYVIEGPAIRRRGEVVQELRWRRTAAGWVIIGERDARVLRSS